MEQATRTRGASFARCYHRYCSFDGALKRESQLAQVPECRIRAGGKHHVDVPGRIVAGERILNEQEVLPLEERRQPEVEADSVHRYVHAATGAEVVIRELEIIEFASFRANW